MRKQGTRILVGVLLILGWGVCFGKAPAATAPAGDEPTHANRRCSEDKALDANIKSLVEGNSRFAADLYGRLKEKEGNLFFSPLSLSTALAMTYAGAEGRTEDEMAKVLRFTLPEAELHPAFARLQEAVVGDMGEQNQLRVANRLWGQAGYEFLPAFLETTRKHYRAELGAVDFARQTEEARRKINSWVEDQTVQKIKDLIGPGVLDPETRLVLTNAIYFKGMWDKPFHERLTRDAPFHRPGGDQVQVPMMHQAARFGYKAADGVQVLEMPYAGGALSMVVLLPAKQGGLPELEKRLTGDRLREWVAELPRQEVRVYLPRFQMTSQFGLKDVLSSMGMAAAFDPRQADFSGMTRDEDLFISAVIHKAFVDVNEEGTEAAAATGIIMMPTSAPMEEPAVFRADHPFLFAIRDNRSGSILFLGRVVNPKE